MPNLFISPHFWSHFVEMRSHMVTLRNFDGTTCILKIMTCTKIIICTKFHSNRQINIEILEGAQCAPPPPPPWTWKTSKYIDWAL